MSETAQQPVKTATPSSALKGQGEEHPWPEAKQSPPERPPFTPGRPAGGGGITPACTPASEDADEEEADGRARRERREREGDPNSRCFLPNRDLSPLDERLRHRSEQGDSQARSWRLAKPVAEAATAGEPTPGARTLADEHAEGAADGSGAAGPGNTQAPETLAAKNAEPMTTSH